MKKITLFEITFTLLLTNMLLLTSIVPQVKAKNSLNIRTNFHNEDTFSFPKYSAVTSPWRDWNHYHNYTEIVDTLLYLNYTYPETVSVFSIGKSWQNRDIYCIRLTNESITNPKPKVLFIGYHHARELISAELPLYFAVEAATKFGINETTTHMLNYSEIYIVPALNVDAFEIVQANEWQRKNVHPFDEDGDGLLDEDPPDDEDGDGYIEGLWQWNGSQWVFIRWEGVDDDGDGLLNEDWVGGVDLNRNYNYKWNATVESGSPYLEAEDYRGPAPFSEPETQAIRDLALQHNFKYAISFHSGAEIILYPWGYTSTPTPHDATFQEIAGNLSNLVNTSYTQGGVGLYTVSGEWGDWMYGNRSTFAFTCEIYRNNSAWQYEAGPYPNSWWEKGVFQFFNPNPNDIEPTIQRWLPVFTYITNRSITEAYNIAVTSITTTKTIVGQGYPVLINVTVMRQGYFTETLNVTVYVNSTSIASKNVTFSDGYYTNIIFIWNTTRASIGNYAISAYVYPLPNEAYINDNNFTDGYVYVGCFCDVDANGKVEAKDIALIISAYGKTYKSPGWYEPDWYTNYDVDCDGKVEAKDIAYAIANYGHTVC